MSDEFETEERCNTTLGLGTGGGIMMKKEKKQYSSKNNNNNKKAFWLDLSLPLHPKSTDQPSDDRKNIDDDEKDDQDSFSNRSIDDQHEEEEDDERSRVKRSSSNANVYNNNNMTSSSTDNGSRKKLKLTTEQTTLLEDSFKIHSTLNTGQKQDLAKKLNLLPRQIEVWFQNRRARTKLKQIEQECELLKKCCETLTEENRRLKKELQEVRCCSLKFDHTSTTLPFYIGRYPTTVSAAMHHPPRGAIIIGNTTGEESKAVAVVTGGGMGQNMHDNNSKIE